MPENKKTQPTTDSATSDTGTKEVTNEVTNESPSVTESVKPAEPTSTSNEAVSTSVQNITEAETTANQSDVATADGADSGAVSPATSTSADAPAFSWKPYIWALLVIAVMGLVLLFVMEQQGRSSTNVFGSLTSVESQPAATVNGVAIERDDFDRNLEQVMREVEAQGFTGELEPEMEANLREQAVQSLINAELLKQAADASGATVSEEQISGRIAELEEQNGGADELASLMEEFGITDEQLRRDIEREILIQSHLDSQLDLASVTVSDEELESAYEQILSSNEGMEIPPLAEVRSVLEEQLLNERQQQVIGEYIESLRTEADIQINV